MSDNRIVKIEHEDEWSFYNTFCKDRLTRMEETINGIHAIVTNGLVTRVSTLWKLAWILLGGIITTLIAIIVNILAHL